MLHVDAAHWTPVTLLVQSVAHELPHAPRLRVSPVTSSSQPFA